MNKFFQLTRAKAFFLALPFLAAMLWMPEAKAGHYNSSYGNQNCGYYYDSYSNNYYRYNCYAKSHWDIEPNPYSWYHSNGYQSPRDFSIYNYNYGYANYNYNFGQSYYPSYYGNNYSQPSSYQYGKYGSYYSDYYSNSDYIYGKSGYSDYNYNYNCYNKSYGGYSCQPSYNFSSNYYINP